MQKRMTQKQMKAYAKWLRVYKRDMQATYYLLNHANFDLYFGILDAAEKERNAKKAKNP